MFYLLRSICNRELSNQLTRSVLHVIVPSFGLAAKPCDKKATRDCGYQIPEIETFVYVYKSDDPNMPEFHRSYFLSRSKRAPFLFQTLP